MKVADSVGYIAGAFDMFGVNDLRHLQRARRACDFLFVGVLGDDVVVDLTGKDAVIPFSERLEIVRSMRLVDAAVGQFTTSAEPAWQQLRFHRLFSWIDDSHDDDIDWESLGVERLGAPGGGAHVLTPNHWGNPS